MIEDDMTLVEYRCTVELEVVNEETGDTTKQRYPAEDGCRRFMVPGVNKPNLRCGKHDQPFIQIEGTGAPNTIGGVVIAQHASGGTKAVPLGDARAILRARYEELFGMPPDGRLGEHRLQTIIAEEEARLKAQEPAQ